MPRENFRLFATVPDPVLWSQDLKRLVAKPSPFLHGCRAARDLFWNILGRRYLRARSRGDKSRLMRDTGSLAQSYYPHERDDFGQIYAALDSPSKVAEIHEDESKPRLMVIKPVRAKALFIPLGLRPVSRGILPKTSSVAEGGLVKGTDFIFRQIVRVTRRLPSMHALKFGENIYHGQAEKAYQEEMVRRWDGLGDVHMTRVGD